MTVYTTLPLDDSNLEVELTENSDLVTLNINPAQVTGSGGALGTVTNVATGTGLTGGPITTSGTIAIDETSDISFNSVTSDFFGVQHFTAKARETISAGQPVYISGHSGNTPEVMVADYDDPAKMPAFGIASADIANNNNGSISTYGDLKNVDTTGTTEGETWAVGDELFVNGSKLTNIRPSSATQEIQKIAKIIRVHANTGQMFLMGAGRSNDVPNLSHYNVFIGNAGGVEKRQLTYTDILATPDLSNYITASSTETLTNKSGNISQWTNDAGYTTNTGTVTPSSTDTFTNKSGNISQWTNDAGYITSSSDSQTLSFANPNLSISNGNSVDLSALTPSTLAWSAITGTPTTIAGYGITDAFSGAYADLTGKPTLFDGAFSSLTGTPTTIAGYGITDAFSGAYADLTGKPTLFSGAYADLTGKPTIPTQTTINNNANNRVITGSDTADTLEGEADFTWDGSNGLMSGTSNNYDSPILHLKTDTSGYNKTQLLCEDDNGKVFAQVGQHNTVGSLYQWNITLDPDNTHGRSGVTTYAGDYFVSFEKNYSDQSAIRMDMQVYGANDGFVIKVRDDFNSGGGNQYGSKPLVVDASEFIFRNDNGDELAYPQNDGSANQVLTTDGNGNITFQDAGGLAASTTPTLTGDATGYQGLDYTVTVTNYSSYVPNSQFRVEVTKNSDSSVAITPQDVTDNGDGTFTFVVPSGASGAHTVRVKGQDFNKGESAEATMSLTLAELAITARYWRIKDFDDGGSAINTAFQCANFRMHTNAGQGGTNYPADMTAYNNPSPYVVDEAGAYNATYAGWKAFDSNLSSFYWNLSGDMSTDYVGIDLGSAQTIKSFTFRSGISSGTPGPFTIYYATQSDFSDEVKLKRLEFTAIGQTITFG